MVDKITVTIPTDDARSDKAALSQYRQLFGSDVVVLRAGDVRTHIEYPAGYCQTCGRDLTDDMLELDPDTLCDRCFEQWQTLVHCR